MNFKTALRISLLGAVVTVVERIIFMFLFVFYGMDTMLTQNPAHLANAVFIYAGITMLTISIIVGSHLGFIVEHLTKKTNIGYRVMWSLAGCALILTTLIRFVPAFHTMDRLKTSIRQQLHSPTKSGSAQHAKAFKKLERGI